MKMKQMKQSMLLLLAAMIWGCAFVAQSTGGEAVGPYSFNGIRSFIGSLVLLPVIALLDKYGDANHKPSTKEEHRQLWLGGICCGSCLFLASTAQQLGLFLGTNAGKAGFITASYILIVPIIGLFLHKKCANHVWVCVFAALLGLYLLCMTSGFTMERGDVFVLSCAFLFSAQIMFVDYFAPKVDCVRLSSIEFLITGLCSLIPMYLKEIRPIGFSAWISLFFDGGVWVALLYAGVLSCGVAYTFQVIGQRELNPTLASLLMSLESVFSVIAGTIILHEHMKPRELMGCLVLFAAIICSQIPADVFRFKKRVRGNAKEAA